MTYPTLLIPTTVVGSYPQPDWLIDRAALEKHGVPRVHAHEIWRVPEAHLKEAQDDATILAIGEMERIGIDIVSDGEMRRESYSNYFSLALEGIDPEQPGRGDRRQRPLDAGGAGHRQDPPQGQGRGRRRRVPRHARDARDQDHAARPVHDGAAGAERVLQGRGRAGDGLRRRGQRRTASDLKATGVDVVQLDEPWVRAAPDKAARYGVAAINRALDGIGGPTAVHICLGYGHLVRNKPSGYAFLPQLADSLASQVSLEAAQPHLDLGVLAELSQKTILLGRARSRQRRG